MVESSDIFGVEKDYTGTIQEGDFRVSILTNADEIRQACLLRDKIFCQELKWTPKTKGPFETDEYDKHAVFFGVFDRRMKLSAFVRLIPSDAPFMLEKDFESLIDPRHRISKNDDTAEISRLCVAPEARVKTICSSFGHYSLAVLLLKSVYHWCRRNKKRYLYAVTVRKVHRSFRIRGFPYRSIGVPKLMPDGVVALPVVMDWKEFEAVNRVKRPGMFEWFTRH